MTEPGVDESTGSGRRARRPASQRSDATLLASTVGERGDVAAQCDDAAGECGDAASSERGDATGAR